MFNDDRIDSHSGSVAPALAGSRDLVMTVIRIIATPELVAVSIAEQCSGRKCYCCGETIEIDTDDRRYAVEVDEKLFCSGECANWCKLFHVGALSHDSDLVS